MFPRNVLILPLLLCLRSFPLAAGPITNNLVLWLKADAGLAADGSTWLDQSGQGHDATAVAGQSPTVLSNGINGLPAVQFNGGQSMSIAGQVLTDPLNYTVIALVTDATGTPAGFREVFSNWDGSNELTSVFLGTTNFNPVNVRFTDDVGGATDTHSRVQQGEGTLTDPANPFILTGNSSATDAAIYQNSTLLFDNQAPISSRNMTTAYFLGRQGSSSFEFWNGDIAEILVYNSSLSQTDMNTDVTYLTGKWLTASTGVPEPELLFPLAAGLAALALLKRK